MTKAEMQELIGVLADEVRGYLADAIASLPRPENGKDGTPGLGIKGVWQHDEHFTLELTDGTMMDIALPKALAGKDADPAVVRAMVDEAVAALPPAPAGKDADPDAIIKAVLEAIPAPKDGKDGHDADEKMVKAMVLDAVAALPPAPAGKDADPERVQEMVDVAVAAIPRPRDGVDGKSITVDDVLPTLQDAAQKALDAMGARWALEFERRAQDQLRRAIEAIPVPRDGIDGMGIEDLTVTDDGEGLVTFKFTRGDVSREFQVRVPCFIDRGVYREDVADYLRGNGVSFGGSLWLAQVDNPQGRPGTVEGQWRLSVKKGRDANPDRPAPPPGPVKLR